MFQARKQKIEAVGELTENMKLTGEDRPSFGANLWPCLVGSGPSAYSQRRCRM